MKLKVVIHEEDGVYWAEIPALRGCYSQGHTRDEALAGIREAATGWLEAACEVEATDRQAQVAVIDL
ncbi:hypothetical protein AYO40_00620 [Planctomycetaceae bacterium SCGC AG-212-D15]|nr:hypothetical protein AYO40_00620 [Planctomycetaceae bacterium SCGC AG-212-D15]